MVLPRLLLSLVDQGHYPIPLQVELREWLNVWAADAVGWAVRMRKKGKVIIRSRGCRLFRKLIVIY